jgi:hypothetical protein
MGEVICYEYDIPPTASRVYPEARANTREIVGSDLLILLVNNHVNVKNM